MGPPIIKLNDALIVSITPYFLEKGGIWFEENLKKILEAKKTQSFFEDNVLYLEKNQTINFSQVLRKIDELGYEKVLQVRDPGEFSQRGGIIDAFPINLSHAVRFDFLGNKIEDIRALDIKIADEEKAKNILKKKLKSQKLFSDLRGLKPGDYLVHLDHGVAQFLGIEKSQIINPNAQPSPKSQALSHPDYYILGYAAGDKLYVPLGLERKLSRYVGFTDPKVSRLGSLLWQKTKKRAREDAEKFAKDLLDIYAKRKVAARPPYLQADEFDSLLTDSFKHEETPDQLEAVEEIRQDLEKTEPMDRIVCGDVGFGKTEIALRAMIKVVKSGYQAVMICPTTILASQHFNNFKTRLKDLPVKIALLSRLQTKKEQHAIMEELKTGKIDIIIGTHRLLSKDASTLLFPKEIGILVIDDEQRFGVKQKEKLKQLRSKIDVLSLSATPIPRTLYMALSSLKNISLVQTPPEGRLPIKTFALPYSKKIIKDAIAKELKRNGQVYYLHNRIETIETAKKNIQAFSPGARIRTAHGRMKEKDLIKMMQDLQNKKIDVLIATTIIENGLDFPDVNTLIVADSGRLGLSQAYQIRGRVGRSRKEAFAYFLHRKRLGEKANLRLRALQEAAELGSGYKIALKDLEIRGAGNLLGKEQSGNVNRVGLNLYCQMIGESVERLRPDSNV